MATATRNKKAKSLKQLLAKRANLLGSAQIIHDFDTNFDASQSPEIPFRLERLDKLWEELENVDVELEALRGEDPASAETRGTFQNLYYRLKGSLTSKLPASVPAIQPAPAPHYLNPSPSGIRLPELKIPEFDGNPEDWAGFHDLFKSMIHDNHQLSHIQKLHYLRASLKGDASRIISSLPISAHSYIVAWKLITDRYEDKNLLIKQHIAALFSVPPVRDESAAGLSELADEFEKHVKILDSLETKAQHWDSVLVELLFCRMDATSQKQWESNRDKTRRPSYDDLIKFIHEQSRTLQSLKLSQSVCLTSSGVNQSKSRPVSNHSASEQAVKCAACKQEHFLFQCEVFREQTPQQRFELVKKHNLCINCIKASHQAKYCRSGYCRYCQKKHHTLLHLPSSISMVATGTPSHTQQIEAVSSLQQQFATNPNLSHSPSISFHSDSAVASVAHSFPFPPPSEVTTHLPSSVTVIPPSTVSQTVTPINFGKCTVILFTALVNVHDNLGNCFVARALLDSGSQSSFISESLCERLSINRSMVNMPVSGIGQAVVNVNYTVSVNISSRFGSRAFPLDCLVLPNLTLNLPTHTVDIRTWKIPNYLPLADPEFYLSRGIDLIIGAELFPLILLPEQIPFDDQLPPLQKTSFGYVFSGKVPATTTMPVTTCLLSTLYCPDTQINSFQEVKKINSDQYITTGEQQCSVAANRFTAEGKPLRSDGAQRLCYVEPKEEYKRLYRKKEVMTRVAILQYFLPHQAVLCPDPPKTKIMDVIDNLSMIRNQFQINNLRKLWQTVQPSNWCKGYPTPRLKINFWSTAQFFMTCVCNRPHASYQFVTAFPSSCVTSALLFEHLGLEYSGPILVRPHAGTGMPIKVCITVYVRFAVKVVVLDIVAGVSVAACVDSLKRLANFVGRDRVIHCDNIFVGASREVKEMRQILEKEKGNTVCFIGIHLQSKWKLYLLSIEVVQQTAKASAGKERNST